MQPRAVEQLDVSVQVRGREDGGISVTSTDVPGILLSGADGAKIWALVGPVLKHLLEVNHGYRVDRVMYPNTYPAGVGPHDVAVHMEHFVVLLAAA